jgi:hypothetical protein
MGTAAMSASTFTAGLIGALVVGAVGAVAGVGMRIPPDSGVSSASHAADAKATERNLARAETHPRVERAPAAPRVEHGGPSARPPALELQVRRDPPRPPPALSQGPAHPLPSRSRGLPHFGPPAKDRSVIKAQHRVSRPSKADPAHV